MKGETKSFTGQAPGFRAGEACFRFSCPLLLPPSASVVLPNTGSDLLASVSSIKIPCCRGAKIIFLCLSEFLFKTPVIKKQVNKKNEWKFVNVWASCLHGRCLGKQITQKMALGFRIRAHLHRESGG